MILAVFDIDGTLTDTSKIDAACYVQAFQETFGIPMPASRQRSSPEHLGEQPGKKIWNP